MFGVREKNKMGIRRFLLLSIMLLGMGFSFLQPQNVQAAACSRYYMVQPGDDLYRIAALFGVDWMSIASVNGIVSPYTLRVGQTLCIPISYPVTSTYTYTYPTTYVVPAVYSSTYYPYTYAYPYGCTRYHVVQWGENLYRIGLLYGVSWTTLASLNNISNPNAVYVGQTICVAANVNPYIPPSYCRVRHTVQPGQTLYQIANIYGTNWTTLAWINNLPNPHTIYAGQSLCIFP